MNELFNNQWVIGIGTGIISSIIVFFFTRRFFIKSQHREYNLKINTANNEILYTIRPLIVENHKPNINIINSILLSTSRKYGLRLDDIYDIKNLCDDLTNEIMSNPFLKSEQKVELSTMIYNLKKDSYTDDKSQIITIYNDKKYSSYSYISLLMSVMSGSLALILTFSVDNFSYENNYFESFEILFLAIIIPTIVLITTFILQRLREINRSNFNKLSKNYTKEDTTSE